MQARSFVGYNREMHFGFARILKNLLSWIGIILLSLLVMAVGEWLPFMPAFQRFQGTHPAINLILTGLTLAMTILGILLLVLSQFLVGSQAPPVVTEARTKGPGWFFSGKRISTSFSDEVRFWQLQKAFRNGAWRREPRWQRLTLMLLGAVLLFYGLFGLLFLMFPPGVKFVLLLAVIYASVRSVYAFIVDQPTLSEEDEKN